jgi:hypothetical protein
MKIAIGSLAVLVLSTAAGVASADHVDGNRTGNHDGWSQRHGGWTERHDWDRARDNSGPVRVTAVAAPEISPAATIPALALLGGALIVLRGRYSIKPKI